MNKEDAKILAGLFRESAAAAGPTTYYGIPIGQSGNFLSSEAARTGEMMQEANARTLGAIAGVFEKFAERL